MRRTDVEGTRETARGVTELARGLGYPSLEEFLDDNPGACAAVRDFVLEHGHDREMVPLEEDDDLACPGCGRREGEGLTDGCQDPTGCGFWREVE